MNKKFLSAVLFGALMVSSTGTFVSCKDYDDDIDRIDTELGDLKSKLDALQTEFNAGKYITNVATTAEGITITLNDGSSYPITNGKDGAPGAPGEAGAAGDKVEINDEGFFIINGKVTEWKAIAKDASTGETIKIKTPTVSEDGCWVFYDEKGEAHPTTIKVAPVTAVQNADKTWTLTVFDAEGKKQEIIVPTAASSLTDLMLITRGNGTNTESMPFDFKIAEYAFEYNRNNNSNAPAEKDWAGQRAIVDNGYIMAGAGQIKLQVNPTSVDAADLNLKLVNSKNGYLSNVDFVTTPYTDMEYFDQPTQTRAANVNGLYNLSIADKYIKKTNPDTEKENYWKQFETSVNNANKAVAFAVTAGGDVRSKYEIRVSKGKIEELNNIYFVSAKDQSKLEMRNGTKNDKTLLPKNAEPSEGAGHSNPDAKMEAGVWYNVYADKAAALYDMHLVFDNDDETLFGIQTKEENGMVAIRLTKTPDNITKAAFLLTIQNIDKLGKYEQAKLWIGETSKITSDVTYDPITHQLSKNNTTDTSKDKNFFQIDLTKMKNALGTEGLALWNTKVQKAEVTYYNAKGEKLSGENSQINEFFVKELKDNLKANTDKSVTVGKAATNMIFAVNNTSAATNNFFEVGKQYTAVITFYDAKENGEKLNSIKVPFTFTLPAITELFAIDPGFVQNNVANCYLYMDDFKAAKKAGAATFKLSRIFSKYDTNGFTVKLNANDKIGSTDKKSSELAKLNSVAATSEADATQAANATVTEDVLAYLTLDGTLGEEKGYDQVLKLTIDGKFDNAWEYPSDAVFNFQVKVMSPIEKGKIVPKEGNVVTIKASDLNGYKFGNNVIIGYTYNTEVSYKVMPDKVVKEGGKYLNAWSRTDIKEVTGETGNKLYFEVDNEGKATPATSTTVDNKSVTVEGGLILKGYQVDHTVKTTIKINVKDHWNRVKSSPVPVEITVGE